MTQGPPVAALFDGKSPAVRRIYERLLARCEKFGPYEIEPKKTSVHLVRNTAFAGVHPRKAWLDLTIRTAAPLAGSRLRKNEQVSKNRWHGDVRLFSPDDVDRELAGWLRDAYELAAR